MATRSCRGGGFLSTFTSAYRAHSRAPPALPDIGRLPGGGLVMAHDGPAAMDVDQLRQQLGSLHTSHRCVSSKAPTPGPPRSPGGTA